MTVMTIFERRVMTDSMRIVSPRDKPPGGLCFFRREERAVPSPKGLCHQNKSAILHSRYLRVVVVVVVIARGAFLLVGSFLRHAVI